jgi:AbiV family abortive infection protein
MESDRARRLFEHSFEIIENAVASGTSLFPEDVPKRSELFYEFAGQIELLWRDATTLYERGSYSTAIFLAIVCIEEAIKLEVALFRHHSAEIKNHRDPMLSHRRKHAASVGQAVFLNPRVKNLFPSDQLDAFLATVEGGNLERVRQSALYNDNIGGKPHIPFKEFTEADARFYVAIAGEIIADRLGYDPKHYQYWCELLV